MSHRSASARIVPRTRSHWLAAVAVALLLTACGSEQTELKDPGTGQTSDAASGPETGTLGPDAGDGGSESDAGSEEEPPPPPGVPSSVETTVQTQNPQLGEPVEIGCEMLDQNGEPVSPETDPEWTLVYSPREQFEQPDDSPRMLEPLETGQARVSCAASNFSVVDPDGEQFEVAPGPPHTVRTSLEDDQVEAGTSVETSCRVFDEFGNKLEDLDTSVTIDAMGAGISVDDHTVTVEKTGLYAVTCQHDGAEREVPATLEITPGLPASISMTPNPQKSVYGLGEVVQFSTIVQDEYGNRIPDAQVDFSVNPSADRFGRARWEFNTEDVYTVDAEVTGNTKGGMDLTASAEITVNGEGPAIECENPADGSVVDAAPGDNVKLTGNVDDGHAVDSVSVDGSSVSVSGSGSFSTNLNTRYGINFVDVVATDEYGEENSRTCAFLVADNWQDTQGLDSYLSDAVSLYLGQDALDDGNSGDFFLDSLMDVLHTVLNSDGLIDSVDPDGLDELLYSSNPLKSYSCDARDPVFNSCLHRSSVNYIRDPDQSWGDPGIEPYQTATDKHDVSLSWTYSGLDLEGTFNDLGIRLKVDSSACGVVRGWVYVDSIDIEISTDLELSGGEPSASVTSSDVTNVGNVNPDFGGTCGTLADYLQGILQGIIQDEVESQLESLLDDNIGPVVDDLFSNLEVSALNSTFDVPKLAGSGSVPIDFNVDFSRLETNTSRALIGIGTKFTAQDVQNSSDPDRVPLPGGSIHLDPSTSESVAGAVHVGVFNYALHALWRGGLFDAQLGSSLFGSSAPSGTNASLNVDLPPIARRLDDGDVELMIGAASIDLVYPGLFDDPIEFEVGMVARTGVDVQGGDTLEFNDISIEELYFTPVGVKLDSDSRAVVSSFLRSLFQNVVDESLNSALPALPIPSFTIPSSVSAYGLTQGTELGLTGASLDGTDDHFILEGDFGEIF